MAAPRSWYRMVISDLQFVSAKVDKLSVFQLAPDHCWITHLAAYPKQTIATIRDAFIAIAAVPVLVQPAGPAPVDLGRHWSCEECNVSFATQDH